MKLGNVPVKQALVIEFASEIAVTMLAVMIMMKDHIAFVSVQFVGLAFAKPTWLKRLSTILPAPERCFLRSAHRQGLRQRRALRPAPQSQRR